MQPAELWQETGRWNKMGPELMRVKIVTAVTTRSTDFRRSDHRCGSFRVEVVSSIARQFYHIQTKFRDERRPRFGLMRGREFTMKDAYSFDRDLDGLKKSYQNMYDAYTRIFNRFGLQFRAVAADNGAIGGTGSHEFHVIADTGEDALVYCPSSDYAANMEAAEAVSLLSERQAASQALTKTATPKKSKCEDVAELLGIPLQNTVKSIVLTVEIEEKDAIKKQVWLLLLRGDHELNEIKASKVPAWRTIVSPQKMRLLNTSAPNLVILVLSTPNCQ